LSSNLGPPETQGPYVPPNIIIPEDWKEATLVLTDYLIKMAEAVNAREIAHYQDASLSGGVNISDTISGQVWFTPGDANKFRYGSRTVVDFGVLPNTTTKTVAHGIVTSTNTIFTYIGGCASIPGSSWIPIPFSDTGAGANIELQIDGTNVKIITAANYSTYTQCYVVLEWIESI